ncbi:formate--tetrahydrofolate ligase [Algoriphagus marincola]|uniref:Formate--tetrahydrofolate ligase n=1 Tax=Algoriphagus marincola TaxID=264027 RepID=A0ABS7N6R3_9BACT|nr:formate--tetrahydrofolate ligase [Algoriphagus marincola]MBY5952017.1 formate--tetrahydrofolate ligase [Algoriphagus marincola]
MNDLDIAKSVPPHPIRLITQKLGLPEEKIEPYGKFKAKLDLELIQEEKVQQSKLILVTAITPTPAGEGKTTVTIGLSDALNDLGKNSIAVIREPSLGPVFGLKGGAAGGGWSQVIPMEDINLHFTGDFHAIEKSNNLLAALLDNAIQSKVKNLQIDPRSILWKRAMDMNDRALRNIVCGLGGKSGGVPRETGFQITAASEVMAILCMSQNLEDLKSRFAKIYLGDRLDGSPVFASDLNAQGAMATLMKEAIKPNIVQTLGHHPALIHGGPFANIAQGTNSILATKMGMSLGEYAVTEAGFGSDLGAEKFFNIKCREAGISPKATVLVATIRALKYHGGKPLTDLETEDLEALEKGLPNLEHHLESLKKFEIPVVVAINVFKSDTEAEKKLLIDFCKKLNVPVALSEGWEKGGSGCLGLAKLVIQEAENCNRSFKPTYELEDSVVDKIKKVSQKVYGASDIILSPKAQNQLKKIESLRYQKLPICIAKTQKSISDQEKLIGRPRDFKITIREFEFAAGAGFLIPMAGEILRMPGLPAKPAAESMDISSNGDINGLF